MSRTRAEILACPIDRLTFEQTVERCTQLIEQGGPAQQLSVNVAKLVAMRSDSRLQAVARSSELVSADGQPIVWASRLLRDPVPERVAGIDLMHALLRVAADRGHRVYILGARPPILEKAIFQLRRGYPGLQIVGHHHGYFRDDEVEDVCADIRRARPEMLLVAMSSPRKEYFVADYASALGIPLALGVGGAIDVAAGMTRRAPTWMQRAGLEWLFRLLQEPKRLGRRYVVTNSRFLLMLAGEFFQRSILRRPPMTGQ